MSLSTSELLTVREVAAKLRLDPMTVRKMQWSGRIPYIRLGPKMVRFIWDDVLRALQQATPAALDLPTQG